MTNLPDLGFDKVVADIVAQRTEAEREFFRSGKDRPKPPPLPNATTN